MQIESYTELNYQVYTSDQNFYFFAVAEGQAEVIIHNVDAINKVCSCNNVYAFTDMQELIDKAIELGLTIMEV